MLDYFPVGDLPEILFELITKIDDKIQHVSDSNNLSRQRCAIVEAYNIVIQNQSYTHYTQLNPYSDKIEPKDCVSLGDTISCPFSKEHSQGCGCFGRGYITIRMLSEQGIKFYIRDESKQNDYIKLLNDGELIMNNPKLTQHIQEKQITVQQEGNV